MELHIKTESKGSTLSPLLQTLEQTPKYFGDCTIALRSNLLRELEGETSILATLRLQDIGFPDRTKLDSQVDTGFNSLARLESDNTPDSNHSLQPLSIMLYHIQFRRILEEYHAVDTDSARQEKVLMKLIIPLTQYNNVITAYEPLPKAKSDLIRRTLQPLCKYAEKVLERHFSLRSLDSHILPVVRHKILVSGPNEVYKPIVEVLSRQLIGLLGGVCLVGPMIIMNFQSSTHARLFIVSVCVFTFALFTGITTKASNQEVLASTAAYSAVLVVYIGSVTTSK